LQEKVGRLRKDCQRNYYDANTNLDQAIGESVMATQRIKREAQNDEAGKKRNRMVEPPWIGLW
jgi:hypothetical protein